MANLLGIDVSKWQGEMDWTKAIEAEVKFAFIRAGSCNSVTGFCYTDDQFERNSEIAPELLPIGYYWYFRPQHDPLNQADYFSNLIMPENWLLPPVADIENNGGLSPAAYADAIKLFLDRVELLTTMKPLIYTSRSKWAQVEPRIYWPTYDLWVAHYTASPEPLIPEGWLSWLFWQFSADGNGQGAKYGAQSSAIDLNYFNGTLDDLHEYIGAPCIPKIVRVKAWRNAIIQSHVPGVRSSIALKGLHFPVLGKDEDENGKIWYEIGSDPSWWIPAGYCEVVE